MKILLVNKFLYQRGGSETYYFALADALQEAGYQVIYFAMHSSKNVPCRQEKYFIDEVNYYGQSKITQLKQFISLIYSWEAKRKFEQLINEEKPDVVHLNLVHRQITLSIVDVCHRHRIPVIFVAHDLVCTCPRGSLLTPNNKTCRDCYQGHYWNCVKNKCIKGSLSKSIAAFFEAGFYKLHQSYNRIDAYITPSLFYKKEIEKSGITDKPVYHMANLLPRQVEYIQTSRTEKYFLFLGKLIKYKGVFTLLQAFHKANLKDWKLVYAGVGGEEERLREYIIKNNLKDRVILKGFIRGEELRKTTESAYMVVLPSEWYENGPYALMEALAYGKPVIGSNIGGIPEMVVPKETGWLFEPGNVDELANRLKDAVALSVKEYHEMSLHARDFANKTFSAERYVKELTSIYKELMKEKDDKSR